MKSMADEQDEVPELVTFRATRGSFVYAPIPPASSYGHRAELWNVDEWLKEVKTKLVAVADKLFVRLEDPETGELFAECPLPCDGTPLTTAVEPVVDSSRYFVLRVEDRHTRNHAFIGLGFRERGESSDFAAALDEYRQYLRRKNEALQMRQAFERQQQQQQQEGEVHNTDYTLTTAPSGGHVLLGSINLKLGSLNLKQSSTAVSSFLSRAVSLPLNTPDTAGVLKLPPPPAAISRTEQLAGSTLLGTTATAAEHVVPPHGGKICDASSDSHADNSTVGSGLQGMGRPSLGDELDETAQATTHSSKKQHAQESHDSSGSTPVGIECRQTAAPGDKAARQDAGTVGVVVMAAVADDDDSWGDFVG